jgi:hypothetical protein
LRETRSGGCGKVTPMGTGGLFATSRHSRLRRVHEATSRRAAV